MIVDIYNLIKNSDFIVKSTNSFEYTYPELQRDPSIKYMMAGTNNNDINEQTRFCGRISATKVFIYSNTLAAAVEDIEKLTGKFEKETERLNYYRVANPTLNGVNNAEISATENILISSGQLSGCTACSIFLPYYNKIYFFHAGHDRSSAPYSQWNKNADLYNCIALNLNITDYVDDPHGISDDQLFVRLVNLVSRYTNYIIVDIYISKLSSQASKSDMWNSNMNHSSVHGSVSICYYKSGGEMLVSRCNQLYSVHLLKNKEMLYNTKHRKNIFLA